MARTAREWALGIGAVVVLFAAIGVAALGISGRWDRVTHKQPLPRTVVLYTSVDDPVATQVIDHFRQQFGIRVDIVGDTEATKTTGLVQRLADEKAHPKCDVWWSSEALGTALLAKQGAFQPLPSPPLKVGENSPWPAEFKAADGTWHAFAQRSRVIAYNTRWVKSPDVPATLKDLVNPKWKGKVAMARPEFGSTRAHMAALVALHGPAEFRRWLEMLKANEVKLYDGNSAVARAIAMGEADIGLTDTDDVWAGQLNSWPIALRYETNELSLAGSQAKPEEAPGGAAIHADMTSLGPVVIPNTVAIIKDCPHPNEARLLAEFLLSESTERELASMEQHIVPIRSWLVSESDRKLYVVPNPAPIDWDRVAEAMPEAMKICQEVLGN